MHNHYKIYIKRQVLRFFNRQLSTLGLNLAVYLLNKIFRFGVHIYAKSPSQKLEKDFFPF
jgi:hypothetical protein